MLNRGLIVRTALLFLLLSLPGCGGTPASRGTTAETEDEGFTKEEIRLTADDVGPRAGISRMEFTTQVDEKRYRALGDISTSFRPKVKQIYLVGKIRDVPTQANIEVHWKKDSSPEPLLISQVSGSETFSFIASFSPPPEGFIPGTYQARIVINGTDIGGEGFTILGDDPMNQGPRAFKLAVSPKITKNHKPKKPAKKFKSGIKKLHATFKTENIFGSAEATVIWQRNEKDFNEQDIRVNGNGQFSAEITSPSGLPDGMYTVSVLLDGEPSVKTNFIIGSGKGDPTIDTIDLGLSLKDDNMPPKSKKTFSTSDPAIFAGVRFLDMLVGSVIVVTWNKIESGEVSEYHRTQNHIPHGGSGTLGSMWEPPSGFSSGKYKVIVLIDDEPAAEKAFTIH